MTTEPDCYFGDHDYQGGGSCVRCGHRLRCSCGLLMRADADWNAHVERHHPEAE